MTTGRERPPPAWVDCLALQLGELPRGHPLRGNLRDILLFWMLHNAPGLRPGAPCSSPPRRCCGTWRPTFSRPPPVSSTKQRGHLTLTPEPRLDCTVLPDVPLDHEGLSHRRGYFFREKKRNRPRSPPPWAIHLAIRYGDEHVLARLCKRWQSLHGDDQARREPKCTRLPPLPPPPAPDAILPVLPRLLQRSHAKKKDIGVWSPWYDLGIHGMDDDFLDSLLLNFSDDVLYVLADPHTKHRYGRRLEHLLCRLGLQALKPTMRLLLEEDDWRLE